MLYELRIYHIYPGRLPAIHKRFSAVTLDLFKKHGIKVCDFFEDADGAEKVYYICEFADRKHRDDAFAGFGEDPEWIVAYQASHEDGGCIVEKVESIFMNRVPYILNPYSFPVFFDYFHSFLAQTQKDLNADHNFK